MTASPEFVRLSSSYRDPAGHMIRRDGSLLRLVKPAGLADNDALRESGPYESLVPSGQRVPYEAAEGAPAGHWLLRPRVVPFDSYPNELPPSALRDAAPLTLDVMEEALEQDPGLKDASAYYVLFEGTRPVFIDHSSFRRRPEGAPWPACQELPFLTDRRGPCPAHALETASGADDSPP